MKKLLILFLVFIAVGAKCFSFEQYTNSALDYTVVNLKISPMNLYFGLLKIGDSVTKTFTLESKGNTPVIIKELSLKTKKEGLLSQGFRLDYSWDLNIPIQPGEKRYFTLTFTAENEGEFIDSIGIGDSCLFNYKSFIRASVGTPIIEVSDVDFGTREVGNKMPPIISTIYNNGNVALSIFGLKDVTNKVFFHDLPNSISASNPLIIERGGQFQFIVAFNPDSVRLYTDSIVFISDAGNKYDPVCLINGIGSPNSINDTYSKKMDIKIIPNPASDYINVDMSFLRMQESRIEIYNIFGECVLSVETQCIASLQRIDVSSLPAGVYFVKMNNQTPVKFIKL